MSVVRWRAWPVRRRAWSEESRSRQPVIGRNNQAGQVVENVSRRMWSASASMGQGCRFVYTLVSGSSSSLRFFRSSHDQFGVVGRISICAKRPNWPHPPLMGTAGNARKISILVLSQAGSRHWRPHGRKVPSASPVSSDLPSARSAGPAEFWTKNLPTHGSLIPP